MSWIPVAWVEAYFRTKWYPDKYSRLAIIDIGRKVWGLLCPFPWRELGGSGSGIWVSNTGNVAGPRPTSISSGILIYPIIGHNTPTLQTHNKTDKTTVP